jgi:hypothetical protein
MRIAEFYEQRLLYVRLSMHDNEARLMQAVMNCMGDCRWYRNQDGPSLELAEYPRLKRAMKLFVGGLGNGLGGMPFDELPSMLTGDPRVNS